MFPSAQVPAPYNRQGLPAGSQEEAVPRKAGNTSGWIDMSAMELDRKNVQVPLKVWSKIREMKSDKEKRLAKEGHAREVTLGEIVADAVGIKV
jgi:hypothetical protein